MVKCGGSLFLPSSTIFLKISGVVALCSMWIFLNRISMSRIQMGYSRWICHSQRFKQENMLLGILPNFVHEPPSLNTSYAICWWTYGILESRCEIVYSRVTKIQTSFQNSIDVHCIWYLCCKMWLQVILDVHVVHNFFLVALVLRTVVDFKENHGLHNSSRTTYKLKACKTAAQIEAIETETSIKYSVLTKLP